MKTIKVIFILLFLANAMNAQDPRLAVVKIKTSSQCELCKERIEEALTFEKGVKSSELDLETKIVTVGYRNNMTSPEKIRTAISKAGYDADDVPADPRAYSKLPACCKKPEDPDHRTH